MKRSNGWYNPSNPTFPAPYPPILSLLGVKVLPSPNFLGSYGPTFTSTLTLAIVRVSALTFQFDLLSHTEKLGPYLSFPPSPTHSPTPTPTPIT